MHDCLIDLATERTQWRLVGAAQPEFGRAGPERLDGQLRIQDREELAGASGSPGDSDYEPVAYDLWLAQSQLDLLADAGGGSAEPDARQVATLANRLRDRRRQPPFRGLEQLAADTVSRLLDVHIVPYVHAWSVAQKSSHTKGRTALRLLAVWPQHGLGAFAMQALADLAEHDEHMRRRVLPLLTELTRTGTPAMHSRRRKLLARL